MTRPNVTLPYQYAGRTIPQQTRRFRPGSQILTLDDPFPGQGTTAARTNVLLFTPDNKASSVCSGASTSSAQLPANLFLTVGYVGSKTSNIDNTIPNFNSPGSVPEHRHQQPPAISGLREPGRRQRSRGCWATSAIWTALPTATTSHCKCRREKRYSHGLTVGLAYTYSKARGEGYGRNDPSGDVQSAYQDPRNRRADRQRYGFDVTHNVVMNYVYDLPFFSNAKGLVGQVLGGWQIQRRDYAANRNSIHRDTAAT